MTLIEAVRVTIRRLHSSPRTEEAYVSWIRQFIRFHSGRHPRQMGAEQVTAFLNELAVARRTSASTQNQALCALLFLYKRVLELEIPRLEALERARRPEHLPAVLSQKDALALLEHLAPPFRLIGELLYGSGLRLLESLAIRVKDVDLERRQIMVRRGKGQHDRPTLLPVRARDELRIQLDSVARRHQTEIAAGRGEVDLPHALRTAKRGHQPCLAIPLPRHASVHGPGNRPTGSPSPARIGGAKGRAGCGTRGRAHQAGNVPYPPPQLCDPPARDRHRHQDNSDVARTQRREDHDDLHPYHRPRSARRH